MAAAEGGWSLTRPPAGSPAAGLPPQRLPGAAWAQGPTGQCRAKCGLCRAYKGMGGHHWGPISCSSPLPKPWERATSGAHLQSGIPYPHSPHGVTGSPKTCRAKAGCLLLCPLEPAGQELIGHEVIVKILCKSAFCCAFQC